MSRNETKRNIVYVDDLIINNLYGLFSIKKRITCLTARHICSYGRYYPISTSRGALGGSNNDFKETNYCFLRKKVGCDRANTSLWNLNATSLLVYIDNIHRLHLKGQTQILSQNWNWFKIYSHGFIPKWIMARQWLYDISHLQRRQTNNIYARWNNGNIS